MKKIRRVWVILLAVLAFAVIAGIFYSRAVVQPQQSERSLQDLEESEAPFNLEELEEEAEKIRGLNFKRPVEHKTMNSEELQSYLLETAFNESNMEDISRTEKVFVALHVWNESKSLGDSMVGSYTEGVAGFYDTDKKFFYEVIGGTEPIFWRKVTCIHELTHALQHQHFPEVFELMEANETNDDEALAFLTLIEGDATFMTQAYLMNKMGGLTEEERSELMNYAMGRIQEGPQLDPLIEKIMNFPYFQGLDFVFNLYLREDLQGINNAFLNPPTTTEQVMHPEKYLEGEIGRKVSLPSKPIRNQAGWRVIDENVFGEAMIYLVLSYHLSEEEARSSAEGWNGDRYAYYENESDYLLISKQRWDSREDALEFYNSWYNFTEAWSSNQHLKPIDAPLHKLGLFPPRNEQSLKVGDTYVFFKRVRDETIVIETGNFDILKKAKRKI